MNKESTMYVNVPELGLMYLRKGNIPAFKCFKPLCIDFVEESYLEDDPRWLPGYRYLDSEGFLEQARERFYPE